MIPRGCLALPRLRRVFGCVEAVRIAVYYELGGCRSNRTTLLETFQAATGSMARLAEGPDLGVLRQEMAEMRHWC